MIGKELLGEVLGFKIKDIIFEHEKILFKAQKERTFREINIYELAHKCKEWAIENDLMFDIEYHQVISRNNKHISIKTYGRDSRRFSGNTEPEAIFKACEWIMENKDDNNR